MVSRRSGPLKLFFVLKRFGGMAVHVEDLPFNMAQIDEAFSEIFLERFATLGLQGAIEDFDCFRDQERPGALL